MHVNTLHMYIVRLLGIYVRTQIELALRGLNHNISHTHLKNINKTVVPRTDTQTHKQTNTPRL